MKRIGMLLVLVLALAASMTLGTASVVEAANCVKPTWCSTVGCCNNTQCAAYCQSIHGGAPGCFNPYGTGGCCGCRPLEG